MDKYFLYILYSGTADRYYIGATANLEDRIRRHNGPHKGFTSKAKDWKLVYHEEFSTMVQALSREKELKSWKSRKLLEHLIESS